MRAETLCLVGLTVLATATGTAVATDNTPPLAAAGVDQTVSPGTTVYLDANGSTDPDGTITSVDWTIETPDGTAQSPACGTCRQTHFEAATAGQYIVTLSTTDDDGATRSDTLYVTAEDEDGPSVSLSGPTTITSGDGATYTVSASSSDASLDSLSWVVNGDVVSQSDLSGSDTSGSFTTSFGTTDNVSIVAVAYDTLGYRGSESRIVNVEDGGGGGGGGPSRCDTGEAWAGLCNGGADPVVSYDGERTLMDTNGQQGFQTIEDGDVVSYNDLTESPYISVEEGTGDSLVVEDGVDVDTALQEAGNQRVVGSTGSGNLGTETSSNNDDDSSKGNAPENGYFPTFGAPDSGSDGGGGGGDDGDGGGGDDGDDGDGGGGGGGDDGGKSKDGGGGLAGGGGGGGKL
jgi:hypothetical protein